MPWENFLRRTFGCSLFGYTDPCPDVEGMASVKKMRLLNAAVAALSADPGECYLEIGTYQGKSLVGALQGNRHCYAVACDNFSEFESPDNPRNEKILDANLARHGLQEQVRFFNCPFSQLINSWTPKCLPKVGVYFYDGAHDEQSQYEGIALVEPLLADNAVVFVDDWRFAEDSQSHAKIGTQRAIQASRAQWRCLYELPASYNGDPVLWWNGLGVFSFRRNG